MYNKGYMYNKSYMYNKAICTIKVICTIKLFVQCFVVNEVLLCLVHSVVSVYLFK